MKENCNHLKLFRNLKVGSTCLAKHTDELWHLATVKSLDQDQVCVQFKKFNQTSALEWSDVLPLNCEKFYVLVFWFLSGSNYFFHTIVSDDESEEEDEDDSESDSYDDEEEEKIDHAEKNDSNEIKNVSHEFGNWEKYTKVMKISF